MKQLIKEYKGVALMYLVVTIAMCLFIVLI